jgi:exonuclease VII small subunit/uncharacterized protein YidB (DUF937 family)
MANAAAQQKVEEHNARVTALKDTLNETTGALTEASAAQVQASLDQTKAKDLADQIGVSYRDVQQAVLGNEEAYARVTAAVDKYSAAMTTGDANADTWNATFMEGQGHVRDFNVILEEHRASVDAAQQAKHEMIQADREAAAAMSEAGRSNQRFNEALQVARDITQDAETRVRALRQALDELKGGSVSAEEAQAKLSETNLSLAEGLSRADEAGNSLWASLVTGTGEIDKSSQAGLDFYNTMDRARSGMLDAARQASDVALANGDIAGAYKAAQEAGDGYLATLQQTMRDQGVAEEKIAALTAHYLDVPSVVATALTDNGTISEVDQRALALALQLEGIPEGKSITVDDPGSPAVIQRLRDVGLKVEAIPGTKQIQITQSGADAVESILNNLVRHRVAEVGVRYTGGGGTMTKADGGVVGHASGRSVDMRSFANGGGFPTGIFAGGPPLIKFAEPETGWEAFISGRKGQEARNAKIAMDALARLGFPVVPVSALRGIPAFANGGGVNHSSAVSGRPPVGAVPVQRRERRRGRRGMLAQTINIGEKASSNDFRNAVSILGQLMDEYEREG